MIVGHKEIINQLKNLADSKYLPHGYIFFGSHRVGKKTIALSLANYLENKVFDKSQKILSDFFVIDADKINDINSDDVSTLEEIKSIKNFLWQKPNISYYRTVLIDNAENLNQYAQNALLKISEEPQKHSLIILICRDPELFLPTLSSRFQKIYFGLVEDKEIEKWLVSEFKIKKEEAGKIAKNSFGLPGISYALLKDEMFQKNINDAKMFLKLRGKERINFIKELIDEAKEKGDFDIDGYLEALMFVLKEINKNNTELWKKILKLRMDFRFYNLNSKLQLVALSQFLEK
jgi:DNA polymerase-3 subunit gamma/tau